MKVNEKVEANKSICVGMVIDNMKYIGTVEKVNKNSIKVRFTNYVHKFGSNVCCEGIYNAVAVFKVWKVDSNGNTLYKSTAYGIIEA